jgi:Salt tolerance down-regulator
MPANRRQQTTQSPTSPTAQTTAKYTNKDGSKFITVPKVFSSTDSPEPSPAMAQTATKTNGQTPQPPQEPNGAVAGVNRKKQKRRQKQAEAARVAAGQSQQTLRPNGPSLPSQDRQLPSAGDYERDNGTYDAAEGGRVFYSEEEGDAYSGSYEQSGSPANGYSLPPAGKKASKKKGKGKAAQADREYQSLRPGSNPRRENSHASAVPPPLKTTMSKEKIWNTSSQEERERIKLFWLSLGEEERRSLVKVEKDAVLKKMKEQQKHSCSCTVCGRKRVAIEEELEVLYDAYYEELEQYANNQQGDGPPPMMAASRRFGPMSGLVPPNRLPPAFSGRQPSRGKIVEHFDNEDDDDGEGLGDEEYSEDDYISDEDPAEEIPRSHATDFFNFGQSLTVQGESRNHISANPLTPSQVVFSRLPTICLKTMARSLSR